MKKTLIIATIVLASFGANASNVENHLKTPNAKVLLAGPQGETCCTYTIDLGFISFIYSWRC